MSSTEVFSLLNISTESIKALSPPEKVRTYSEACSIVQQLGRIGTRTVLAQGVFDIIHAGHVGYLRGAAALAGDDGVLVVGVENDASVRHNKGHARPINPLADRLVVLSEFASVGLVFPYPNVADRDTPADFLERYRSVGPTAIAVSSTDPYMELKKMQAAQTGTCIEPVDYEHSNSTTRMLKSLGYQG